jgi:hypothetical protein
MRLPKVSALPTTLAFEMYRSLYIFNRSKEKGRAIADPALSSQMNLFFNSSLEVDLKLGFHYLMF